jgi:2-phosphosulfolactate phosphatase
MKISVFFTPLAVTQNAVGGSVVLVIDILRANTTIVTALANGARSVVPAAAADDAIVLAQSLQSENTVLIGEKRLEPIPGFALGNSPLEMTTEVVDGKTLVMSTTNGTGAYHAVGSGAHVLVGAAVNFSAAAARARDLFDGNGELVIVCAGREKQFALEDAYTAGRFAQAVAAGRGRGAVEFNDGAIAAKELVRRYGDRWKRAIAASAAAKALKNAGYKNDIDAATDSDKYDIVPVYKNKLIELP